MRRAALRRRGGGGDAESPFWISYADLMTSLAILLILMVCAFLLKVHQEKEGLDEQVRVKREVIERLLRQLGKRYPVTVDPRTGAVTISDRILFDFDQSELKPAGQSFLRGFVPDYSAILLRDPHIRQHIAQIMIVGHADRVGAYERNMQLSLFRALSVTSFIFTQIPTFPERENLRQVLSTNGRSFMERRENDALSRRVEIRFQLKDWDAVLADRKAHDLSRPAR